MAQKTQWQKQQARQAAGKPAPVKGPPWWVTLIKVLEEIWAALPASQSEPNHPVAVKLAELKKLPID